MRHACLFCAMKHVVQAGILTMEAKQGYPLHRWWALGHLAEASDELVADYEEMANEIREYRKLAEEDEAVQLPFSEIIAELAQLIEKETSDMKVDKQHSGEKGQVARRPSKRSR